MPESGFEQQVIKAVRAWLAHDREALYLQSDYLALSFYYWLHTATAKACFSPTGFTQMDALAYARQGFDRLDPVRRKLLLAREDHCDACDNERHFTLKQLFWCVECSRHLCMRHYLESPTNVFNDALCECGGVLVGPAILSRGLNQHKKRKTGAGGLKLS